MPILPRRADGSAIFRRYGAGAVAEWQRVCGHFALNEGFALVVLIVPDRDGASLCRQALANRLRAGGMGILDVSPPTPSALCRLAPTLLGLRPEEDCSAVWVAAAVSPSAANHAAWDMAWRWGLATLNQNRNTLRRWIGRSLIFVGTPELVPLFREAAPDLWSVRSMVAHIGPDPNRPITNVPTLAHACGARHPPLVPAPDLDSALCDIERLRGKGGREVELADAVERAAHAYGDRADLPAAEAYFRKALALRDRFDSEAGVARSLLNLSDVLLDQRDAAEAVTLLRRGLSLIGESDPMLRSRLTDMLAHALLAQGRAAEAEPMFREALTLAAEAGLGSLARGVTTDMLARSILVQGRAAEAEVVFRTALGLLEAGGASPVSVGVTLEMLAHAVLAQGRAEEAVMALRRALALAEEGGASAVSRAVTTRTLARAVLARGRKTEAEALLRGALELARHGGAPEDLIRLMGAD